MQLTALNLCQVSHTFLALNEIFFRDKRRRGKIKIPEVKTNVVFTFSICADPYGLSLIIYRRKNLNKKLRDIIQQNY